MQYETAGALGNGEKIFITAKLPGYIKVGNDDYIEKYLFLTTSHDGSGSITAAFTPIRIVCQNTLSAALRNSSNTIKIRHTASAEDRDEYIAANFLKSLIAEWAKKQNEQQTVIETLPVLVIRDVPFIIDPYKRQLIRFNDPEKIISFDELKFNNGFYFFDLDTIAFRPAIDLRGPEALADRIFSVTIPATIIDAPSKMHKSIQDDMNRRSQAQSWGFYLGDKKVSLRLSGVLPYIDLAGTNFTVDWRLRQMRETEQPWNNISFDDFEMDDNGDKYLCFFNTQTHELYMPPEDLTELPAHIVVLEIPNELDLDPIAVAREYGSDLYELLIEHPIAENLTAKVSPLSETGLPAMVENNIRIQQNSTNEKQNRRGR